MPKTKHRSILLYGTVRSCLFNNDTHISWFIISLIHKQFLYSTQTRTATNPVTPPLVAITVVVVAVKGTTMDKSKYGSLESKSELFTYFRERGKRKSSKKLQTREIQGNYRGTLPNILSQHHHCTVHHLIFVKRFKYVC